MKNQKNKLIEDVQKYKKEITFLKSDEKDLITRIEDLEIEYENKNLNIKSEYDEMVKNSKNMEKEMDDWQKEKKRISEIQQIGEIVKLNVGGNTDIQVRR